ncbi:hypothetical protein Ddc_23620 [Ditylenchus destructor]|nr:hypothetical protein Ddc_23620 [Ditylenchus destructor]
MEGYDTDINEETLLEDAIEYWRTYQPPTYVTVESSTSAESPPIMTAQASSSIYLAPEMTQRSHHILPTAPQPTTITAICGETESRRRKGNVSHENLKKRRPLDDEEEKEPPISEVVSKEISKLAWQFRKTY